MRERERESPRAEDPQLLHTAVATYRAAQWRQALRNRPCCCSEQTRSTKPMTRDPDNARTATSGDALGVYTALSTCSTSESGRRVQMSWPGLGSVA